MKRIFLYLILFIFILSGIGNAAESIDFKHYKRDGGFSYVQWSLVTAADGSLTKTASEDSICGLVYAIRVIPDSSTPFTDSVTDIRVTDADEVDLVGGGLDNISNTTPTSASALVGGVAMSYPVNGYLYIDVLDNSVNSGACVVKVFYIRCKGNR